MNSRRHITALVLALAYGLVAVAGHGLHALAPCDDPGCQAAAHAACDCCSHASAAKQSDLDHQAGFRSVDASAHNPHTCAVCTLLSKVKVGHSGTASTTLTTKVVQATPSLAFHVVVADHASSHSPRGPPAAA
jgi:hypothetical protein